MLIVGRKDSQSFLIYPGDSIDPRTTLADVFREGPIEITVCSTREKHVKVAIQAPEYLSIWRKNAATV